MTTLPQRLLGLATEYDSLGDSPARETCREAAAIIAKLPTTADGVPVVPVMVFYYPDPVGDDDWFPKIAELRAEMALENLVYANPGWCDVYSTRAAAEAARGGK